MADLKRLTDLKIKSCVSKGKVGIYADGDGLYLRVTGEGAASWIFRSKHKGKVYVRGIGSLKKRGLADARDKARLMHEALGNGIDPGKSVEDEPEAKMPKARNFKWYAEEFISDRERKHRQGLNKHRSSKHMAQWPSTLERYAYPIIGELAPAEIDLSHIKKMMAQSDFLKPDGKPKVETQYRVLQRVKLILEDAAEMEKEPFRYNPAARFKFQRESANVNNHAAARWQDVPAIMAALRQRDSTSALLLRWSILTACRSGEARGALWAEIDGDMWKIDGKRMKGGNSHFVHICAEGMEILEAMRLINGNANLIFAGPNGGIISDVAINKTLKSVVVECGMKDKVTAHGFRSSFRIWGAEVTNFSPEALEKCLAHKNRNKIESTYQRSNLPEQRTAIMKSWAKVCAGDDNIVKLYRQKD